MTPEISEFSYGFALTNEIVGWVNLRAAPIFPSLIEEGRKGGGYDVKLDVPGVPLYLQFKRAECMTRRSAREIRKDKLDLTIPFYRFSIMEARRSNQHALLLELDDGTNQVLYAAPRFHELEQINRAWTAKEVAARSIFVKPAAIGAIDTDSHHVAYDQSHAYFCSRPRPIAFVTAQGLAESLTTRLETEERSLGEVIPQLNFSLLSAWERGKERAAKAAGRLPTAPILRVPALPGRLALPSPGFPDVSEQAVPTRESRPLAEAEQQLRELADNALKLFDAQLVIVQQRE